MAENNVVDFDDGVLPSKPSPVISVETRDISSLSGLIFSDQVLPISPQARNGIRPTAGSTRPVPIGGIGQIFPFLRLPVTLRKERDELLDRDVVRIVKSRSRDV